MTMGGLDGSLALSPDGTRVVYVGNHATQLFVRALDALEPLAIASGALRGPFVSPDSQWAGFVDSSNTLRKVALTGGPAITLTNIDGAPRGATWGPDDAIVFATANPATGLQRVSAAGDTVEMLTQPERGHGEADHLWPEFLPGGRAVLFTITSETGGLDAAQVAVRDLRTGAQKILVRGGSHALYVSSGHLVYVAADTLRAIPFDLARMETHGTAVPVLTRVATTSTGTGEVAVAADGTLVYVDNPGGTANARTLVWVDRRGTEEPVAAPPRRYQQPRLSPDGTRVALSINDQENDLWIWDIRRVALTRMTLDPGLDFFPAWMPNGQRLMFGSNRGGGQSNLWWQAADGTGVAERLTTGTNSQSVTSIAPDGRVAVFHETTPTMSTDLMQLTLDGTRRVTPLLQTKFAEQNAVVSPDGRWLAYESNSAGTYEIYVRPFPNVSAGQWQVSVGGGMKPVWARNGKELFYVAADGALLRVPVEATGATWNAGAPTKLLEGRYFIAGPNTGPQYDISPDGQRFLMIKSTGSEAGVVSAIVVVQHWDEELKRLVPVARH
jgi:serine/threonine-protein kinase